MSSSEILDRLFEVIQSRRRADGEKSYVASLLEGGVPKVAAKVREESEELIEAASADDRDHTVREAADLLFHTWVLFEAAGIAPAEVYAELDRRFGTSGHDEKRARGADASRAGKAES